MGKITHLDTFKVALGQRFQLFPSFGFTILATAFLGSPFTVNTVDEMLYASDSVSYLEDSGFSGSLNDHLLIEVASLPLRLIFGFPSEPVNQSTDLTRFLNSFSSTLYRSRRNPGLCN
jgi:hypothetical protein